MPPPAPANLEVTSASRTSIGLDWDSRNGISNYRVRYGSNSPETTSSAYTATGLTCGTSYTFNVSAYGDGTTYRAVWGSSASISATTDRCPPTLPPAPANLEVTSTGRTSIGLDWNSRNGISNYRVSYGSNSPETTSSAYTATGLNCGTSYTFEVSAYGDGSTFEDDWGQSASISATTDLCLPPAPANLEVTSTSRTSIGLDWDSRNGISKYRVRYGSNSPETTSSAYTATRLTCGTSYTFEVSAYGDGATFEDDWGPSASISATTDSCNRCPVFADGPTTARSVDENTGSNTNIGSPVSATDLDGDRLTYRKSGDDSASFTLSPSTGQLGASAALDYETKFIYSFSMTVSDGGCTDSIEVTVIVDDVDEPPSAPGAPTVTATSGSTTSLDVSWTAPANGGKPPITGYDLQYRQGTTGSFQAGPQNVAGASATISSLQTNALYQVQVRATNAEGDGPYSSSGSGRTNALPTITIARQAATVTEGQVVRFTLSASPASASALTVKVGVLETGSFLTGPAPTDVTILGGSPTAQLTLRTTDDAVDEADGTIIATVQTGTGYTLGGSSSASVTVQDDDVPPAPTGLRANGNLVGGNVTLRWDPVSGATGYNVRYVEETCDSNGDCTLGSWQTRTNIAVTGTTVKEAFLGGLTKKKLYRAEVQALIVDSSDWSDFTLVFPTDSPLGHGTDVATAPFHGYQAKNAQGSHEFRYVLCTETIPTGLIMTATDMLNAVDEWEDAVIWDRSGVNIVATTAYALPAGEDCSSSAIPAERGRFEVKFASDRRVGNACGKIFPWQDTPPACWRSTTWTRIGVELIERGSVFLNTGRGAAHWNASVAGGACTRLHETIVHEVGHSFGIGNAAGVNFNRHPVNDTLAIMSYANLELYCEPQAYDIVALMALYQSR